MLGRSVVLRLKPFTGRIRFAELAHVGVLAGHGGAPPADGVRQLQEGQGLGGGETGFAHVGVQVLPVLEVIGGNVWPCRLLSYSLQLDL